ncbi:MAG TPA: NAD(P)H-dependent oxidoreductase subunit E [Acetobacteraceae bacterium]
MNTGSGRSGLASYEPWNAARGTAIIAAHIGQEGACLPILHALQAAFGCIPREAVPMVAEALNLTRAEVHGIVSFYHDFRSHPPAATCCSFAAPRPASRSVPMRSPRACASASAWTGTARLRTAP